MKLRSVEETITSLRNADSDKDYRLKELEYAKNAMQQENKNLRVQVRPPHTFSVSGLRDGLCWGRSAY